MNVNISDWYPLGSPLMSTKLNVDIVPEFENLRGDLNKQGNSLVFKISLADVEFHYQMLLLSWLLDIVLLSTRDLFPEHING